MWSRLNVGNPDYTNIDNILNLFHSNISSLFGGSIPNSLSNMYFLNYIPLLTANDIPIAIERVLDNKIALNGSNSSNILAFKNSLMIELNNMKNTIISLLKRLIYIENDFITLNKLSKFRNNSSPDGDIIIHSIIRHNMYIEYNNKKLLFHEYINTKYQEVLDNFSATGLGYVGLLRDPSIGYDSEKNNLILVKDAFFTPIDKIPKYSLYINYQYNIDKNIIINKNELPILSNIISSIWGNILSSFVSNYNDLYCNKILNKTYFNENIGAEMTNYLDYITNTHFGTSIPINYYFDTNHNDLPINGGNIGTYLLNKINILNDQINKYDNNKKLLLDVKNTILSKKIWYFEKYNTILNKLMDSNIKTASGIDIKNNLINLSTVDTHNNAMDIIDMMNTEFEKLINTSVNPFDENTESHKYKLWNDIQESVSATEELNKYVALYGSITSNNLYKDITNINRSYGGFLYENDIYQYMMDAAIKQSNSIIKYPHIDVTREFSTSLLQKKEEKEEDNPCCDNISDHNQKCLEFFIKKKNNNDALIYKIGDETSGLVKTLLNALKFGESANFAWIQRLGHFIIDHIKVKIGGQLQDKHTGEWMELRHELTKKDTKERGYKILIGDVPELTTFDNTIKRQYEMIIPLKFWFCNNMGSSLPLVALQHTDINIIVKLKPFDDCAFFDDNVTFVRKPKLRCNILAEYLYVEEEERTKIVKNKMEYLMDLVQINNDTIITKNSIDEEGMCEIRLYFDNPCKEFVWICQDIDHINGSQRNNEKRWHNYGLDFDTGAINPIHSVQIKFAGRVREEFKEINYYNFIVPIEHHYATPSIGINAYSMALKPELFAPTGAANLTRIDEVSFVVRFKDSTIELMKTQNKKFRFNIYAQSINFLRVMSGQCGQAFYS